jgi:hypothetical protein
MSVTSYITGPARRIALGSTVALIAIGVVACSSTTAPTHTRPHRRASPCRIWSGSIGSTPNQSSIHWAGRVSSSKGLTSRQIRNSGTGSLSRVRRPVSTWTPTAQSHSNSVCETSLPPVVSGAVSGGVGQHRCEDGGHGPPRLSLGTSSMVGIESIANTSSAFDQTDNAGHRRCTTGRGFDW